MNSRLRGIEDRPSKFFDGQQIQERDNKHPKINAPPTPSPPPDGHHPVLPALNFTYKRSYILYYAIFLFFCNVVLPCILFYPLETLTPLGNRTVIGISSASLGVSSCFDSPVRLWNLTRYRRTFGPLGNDTWWYLDFSMWTYTFALLTFAIPLAIAPSIEFYDFFLMSTVMLIGPLGLVFLYSLLRPRLFVRCSSDPAGEHMKPAVFYVIEDVGSVDFKHGREWRRTLHERWHASKAFQHLMKQLTVYWVISAILYCGATAAVTWGAPLRFAFGWVLGQLFVWALLSAMGCRYLAKRGLRKEQEWWMQQEIGAEKSASSPMQSPAVSPGKEQVSTVTLPERAAAHRMPSTRSQPTS